MGLLVLKESELELRCFLFFLPAVCQPTPPQFTHVFGLTWALRFEVRGTFSLSSGWFPFGSVAAPEQYIRDPESFKQGKKS